jgi:hypothetical protein
MVVPLSLRPRLLEVTHERGELTQCRQGEHRGTRCGQRAVQVRVRVRDGHAGVPLRRRERRTPGGGDILSAAIRPLDHPVPGLPPASATDHGQGLTDQGMAGVQHHDKP